MKKRETHIIQHSIKKNEKGGQVDTGSFLKVVRWTGGRESH